MAEEFEKYIIGQKYFESDYISMLRGLLPRGIIWGWDELIISEIVQDVISGDSWLDSISTGTVTQDSYTQASDAEGSLWGRFWSVFAAEFERLETAAWDLLGQTDPGVATDLLEDWERVLDLPGPCVNIAQTVVDRQRAAHAKLFQRNETTTTQWWIDYAETLGFVIEIGGDALVAEPRVMGVARQGRQRMTATRGGYSVLVITVVSGDGNLDQMKCLFEQVKPAHVIIMWVGPDVITWTNSGSANYTSTVQLTAAEVLTIDWGDDTGVENFTGTGVLQTVAHTFPAVTSYTVKMYVDFDEIQQFNAPTMSIFGDVSEWANYPALTGLDLSGTSLTYDYPVAWAPYNGITFDGSDLGLTATEVDNCLIDMDDSGVENSTITIDGTNAARTAASNTAHTNLLARGCTINVN